MTGRQPTRQNCHLHPCPPWCAVDHTRGDPPVTIHIARHGGINTDPGRPHDRLSVQAIHDGIPMRDPVVTISGHIFGVDGLDPFLRLVPRDAEELARLIIMLATATPSSTRSWRPCSATVPPSFAERKRTSEREARQRDDRRRDPRPGRAAAGHLLRG